MKHNIGILAVAILTLLLIVLVVASGSFTKNNEFNNYDANNEIVADDTENDNIEDSITDSSDESYSVVEDDEQSVSEEITNENIREDTYEEHVTGESKVFSEVHDITDVVNNAAMGRYEYTRNLNGLDDCLIGLRSLKVDGDYYNGLTGNTVVDMYISNYCKEHSLGINNVEVHYIDWDPGQQLIRYWIAMSIGDYQRFYEYEGTLYFEETTLSDYENYIEDAYGHQSTMILYTYNPSKSEYKYTATPEEEEAFIKRIHDYDIHMYEYGKWLKDNNLPIPAKVEPYMHLSDEEIHNIYYYDVEEEIKYYK